MYENSITDIVNAQKGNKDAMEKLVKQNSGLIYSIVKRFIGRGYDVEDLYQIGCIGFIKSINKFQPSFETKLSTYAVPYMIRRNKKIYKG